MTDLKFDDSSAETGFGEGVSMSLSSVCVGWSIVTETDCDSVLSSLG